MQVHALDGTARVKLKGIAKIRSGHGVRAEDKTKMEQEITEAESVHKRRLLKKRRLRFVLVL